MRPYWRLPRMEKELCSVPEATWKAMHIGQMEVETQGDDVGNALSNNAVEESQYVGADTEETERHMTINDIEADMWTVKVLSVNSIMVNCFS